MYKQYIQDLRTEFKGYNSSKFSKDLMAGLTVIAVSLPLALAFSVCAGADAVSGLIAAILSSFIIGGLSGASYQISGATGTMTAIFITLISRYGMQGIFIAGLLSGVFLLIACVLKMGRLVSYIPSPVITGFTSGIAIIIAFGQVNNLFGVTSKGSSLIEKFASYATLGFKPNWSAVLIGTIVIVVMLLWPKKLGARLPSSLAGIIIALIVNIIFKLPVAVVGEIPKTLFPDNRLDFFNIPWENIGDFIMPAISIAALSMIETLLCGTSAGRMKNEKINSDRELFALGIGNLIIPFFGGLPSTAALARTSVAIKSGGQTRMTSIIQGVGLLSCMFLLGGTLAQIPLSALAGVLIITSWRMNEFSSIKYFFKNRFKTAMLQYLVTMICTVVFDLTIAIVIGVAVSIVMFVVKMSKMEINVSNVDTEKLTKNGIKLNNKIKDEDIKIIYLTGPVFFGSIDKLNNEVMGLDDSDSAIFSMRGVPLIDAGGAQTVMELIQILQKKDVQVLFCGVQPKVRQVMDRAGITELIGEDSYYWDAVEAINGCNKSEYVIEID